MLLADKRDLQNQLKLSVLRIDEKELDLYTTNCNTVCVEASLLAGFAFTALIENRDKTFADPNMNDTSLQATWFGITTCAMLLEMCALVKSMQLSVMAPGLALRGPEGSMYVSLVVMRREHRKVHAYFYAGLVMFLASIALYVWAFFFAAMATAVTVLVSVGCAWLFYDATRLFQRLRLPSGSSIGGGGGITWSARRSENLGERSECAECKSGLRRQNTASQLIYTASLTEKLRGLRIRPGWMPRFRKSQERQASRERRRNSIATPMRTPSQFDSRGAGEPSSAFTPASTSVPDRMHSPASHQRCPIKQRVSTSSQAPGGQMPSLFGWSPWQQPAARRESEDGLQHRRSSSACQRSTSWTCESPSQNRSPDQIGRPSEEEPSSAPASSRDEELRSTGRGSPSGTAVRAHCQRALPGAGVVPGPVPARAPGVRVQGKDKVVSGSVGKNAAGSSQNNTNALSMLLDAVGWPFRPEPELCGQGSSATSPAQPVAVRTVRVNCREVDATGAGACASWALPRAATLREVRSLAARKLGIATEEAYLVVDGHAIAGDAQLDLPLRSLRPAPGGGVETVELQVRRRL